MSKLLITLEVSVDADNIITNKTELYEYVKHALTTDWSYGDGLSADSEIDVELVQPPPFNPGYEMTERGCKFTGKVEKDNE